MNQSQVTQQQPAQASGWSLKTAGVILGFLTLVVLLIVAAAMRMFDYFDAVTELLLAGAFMLGFIGINGAVIYYLHTMTGKDAHNEPS